MRRSDVTGASGADVQRESAAEDARMVQQEAAKQRTIAAQQAELQAEYNFVPEHPWRAFNGVTNYIKNTDAVEFCGKILEVQPKGVRINGDYDKLFSATYFSSIENDSQNQEFFVANFPFEAAENESVPESRHLMAYYVGTYAYTTVNGGSRTIRKLDYGIPCEPPADLVNKA